MNRAMRWCVLSAAVLGLVARASRSEASQIIVNPTSDRTGVDSNSDGVVDSLRPDNDVYLRVHGTSSFFRAALEFSLSPIQPGSVVSSASLFLYDGGTTINGSVIQIHGYAGNGVVTVGSDFTVNNLVASYTVNGSQGHTLDVTPFLQGLANSGATYAGFMLRSATEISNQLNGADIVSNEGTDNGFNNSLRPTLTVNYSTAAAVPEPGTLAGAGVGLALALGAILKRRRKVA